MRRPGLWLGLLLGLSWAPAVAPFPRRVDLAPDFYLSWELEPGEERVTFELVAGTMGWVGVGVTQTGGMDKADMVVGWVQDGEAFFHDRHGVGNNVPVIDESQDYTLLSLTENGTHTVMRFRRPYRTCDKHDHDITADTLRVIFACSSQDPSSLTDLPPHTNVYGIKSVQLLNFGIVSAPQPRNTSSLSILSNYTIPAQNTFYSCSIGKLPDLSQKHHVYMVEPVIGEGASRYVHHMLLYLCPSSYSDSHLTSTVGCFTNHQQTTLFMMCTEVLAGWAVGGQALIYPETAGFPLGRAEDPSYYMLQIHYDNPSSVSGVVDHSGFRLHLTTDLREHDVGILWTGIEVGKFHLIPPLATSFRSYGYCDTSPIKNQSGVVYEDMNVFGSILHTHLTGSAVRVLQFRDGEQVGVVSEDRSYDFNLQESRLLRETVTVKRGDVLITECTYNTEKRKTLTFGGIDTLKEMCLAFLYYYPKNELLVCLSYHTAEMVANTLNLTFTDTTDLITTLSAWNWTQSVIEDVERKLRDSVQMLSVNSHTAHSVTKRTIPTIPKQTARPCQRQVLSGGSDPRKSSISLLTSCLLLLVPLLSGGYLR